MLGDSQRLFMSQLFRFWDVVFEIKKKHNFRNRLVYYFFMNFLLIKLSPSFRSPPFDYDFRTFTLPRFEAKRQEIEAWLMRMESRSERMGSTETKGDVLDFSILDSQQKEHKVCSRSSEINSFMSIQNSCSSCDIIWNIYWLLCLFDTEFPRRITHLQTPHRTFQSINAETYRRLSWRWHVTNKTHDGER